MKKSTLQQLKEEYKNGLIEKPVYIRKMHQFHELLFKYSKFIKNTDIKKIEIIDDQIIMTARSIDIKLICDNTDTRIAPIEILNFDAFEKNDFPMLLKLVNNNMVFFDIGANVGWISIYISKAFKNVKVYAFEPIQKTFDYLKRNLELNKSKNIKIFNFGFSDAEGWVTFYYTIHDSGSASVVNLSTFFNTTEVKGRVKKLDGFIKEHPVKIDFIKCDVEGSELFVFQGGLEAIKKYKPIIFSEMLRKWSKKFNYHPNDIIDLLGKMEYGCYVSFANKLKEVKRVDESTTETNFFFLHKIKHKKILKRLKG